MPALPGDPVPGYTCPQCGYPDLWHSHPSKISAKDRHRLQEYLDSRQPPETIAE